MAYSAEISRQSPSCILFLIDQSGSMSDKFSGTESTLSQKVADAINNLLSNLVIKCSKDEGVRDYYYVGVIGYGMNTGPVLGGNLVGQELVPISDIANNPTRIEERTKKVDDGAGGLLSQTVKFPIWFDAVANGGTPMKEAFSMVNKVVTNWLEQYPDCFPPTVIHITDGMSTDGSPEKEMTNLINQSSSDGNVLLFNVHISSNSNTTVEFPSNNEMLPDQYSQMLYGSASKLTPFMLEVAKSDYPELSISDGAKAFVLNGNSTLVITALDIGTRPSNLR